MEFRNDTLREGVAETVVLTTVDHFSAPTSDVVEVDFRASELRFFASASLIASFHLLASSLVSKYSLMLR